MKKHLLILLISIYSVISIFSQQLTLVENGKSDYSIIISKMLVNMKGQPLLSCRTILKNCQAADYRLQMIQKENQIMRFLLETLVGTKKRKRIYMISEKMVTGSKQATAN
ncbi:MAG: hypothetical protein IPH57_17935 [Saprospiraceae bacterium]|nr:hypothetical protein [Saprospiraceae bacterium]